MANDLNLPAIADGQADGQWQTSNDGDAALGNALADIYTVDFTAGNVTLTAAQFRSAMTFIPSNLSTTRVLTIPAVKRALFIVHNTDATDTITVTKGSTTVAVGPGEIGLLNTDGTTNSLGGTVVATGGGSVSPIGKHTISIPASAMLAATTSGPAIAQFETTTNDINFVVMDFDATADEHAHFNVCMPKSWDEGTVTFQVWWTTSATDTDGVAWGLQAIALSDNEASDTAWGTAVVVTDDAQGAANEILVTAESSSVTIGGTPASGDIVFFRLFRDVSDANDDMAEDARLIAVKLFYTTDAATDD
ncbi:hypothetical protein [Mesorhizobium sp.]|uniref:hypothetical protein n=1 Tax=Mesorhizobium sp. TaxID=1871066 RepID=UPI000FE5862A|nr:hypothetical protein [Mesorhizobium sp.]RWO20650.1 MAG: hypothetical protein EOS09_26385 [Mesorhizobium sp.]